MILICTKYVEMHESLTAGYILMWKQTMLEAVATMLLRSSSIMWCKQCKFVTVKVARKSNIYGYSLDIHEFLRTKH